LLGARLREKRTEIGMSIKELAEKTGLTSGFISQVERGLAEPSITSLRNISNMLDVPVYYFLLDDIEVNPVVRKNERKVLKFIKSDLNYELLSPDLNRQMEMYIARLKPGERLCKEPLAHTGEEVNHVLHGNMWVQLGSEEYILEEGDTIHFDASKLHNIANNGQVDLEYISAVTPPPEHDSWRHKSTKKKT
jgi:transcriptional regulator with XRE-family HTH domain